MLTKRSVVLLAVAVLAASPHIAGQEPFMPAHTDQPPTIDGKLDDPVWQDAPSVSGYETWAPDYGKEMLGDTRTYMAFDGSNLYFAFHAFDPEPDKIKASVTNRDNIRRDDWVAINLDSFDDQQSLYALYVNPFGIQGDTRYANGREDGGFDMVWFSDGQIDETGYTVEIAIPLKSLRYKDGDTVRMGVIFERSISRRSEMGTYPPLDPAEQEWLTQMHPMVYHGLDSYRLIEVLPAVTYSHRRAQQDGSLTTIAERGDFSLTTKYGITSDLVFDGTYNPDFSQVEADAGQVDVNLRYQLYYPEKRPFFLEGRESFNIAATGASRLDPVLSIVYTRTIVDPIVGAKLSGKLGSKNTVASLYAADEISSTDTTSATEYLHNPILRYKRALNEDSYLGGILAARELSQTHNRVLGLDGQFRLTSSSLLAFNAIGSQAQAAPLAEREKGYTWGLSYNYGTRNIDYGIVAKDVSKSFRADMGFVTRTGLLQFSGLVRPKLYPSPAFIRRIDIEGFSGQTLDRFSDRWETFNHLSGTAHLWGAIRLMLKYQYSTEIFLGEKFNTGGFQTYLGGQLTNQLFASLLYRNVDAIYYSADPYQGRSDRLTGTLIYQPSGQLRADVSLTYTDFFRESDGEKIYDYLIGRMRLTYQLNKYLFFRGILEYNDFRREMLTDLLASFTYIPGTVMHVGYGSLFDRMRWDGTEYVDGDRFQEAKRKLFFKMSYLWRM